MRHVTRRGAPSRALLYSEPGRASIEFGTFVVSSPLLRRAERGDGHAVLVLPGFLADDRSTIILRNYLNLLGYRASGWGLGRNVGPTASLLHGMDARLETLANSSDGPVSLVGWSLGGMFARGLGHKRPDLVRQIVTMGSPFRSREPIGSHAARRFERFAHLHVNDCDLPEIETDRAQLAVPVAAIYSRSDGVVAWRACVQEPGPRRENVEVPGSHCGFGHNPAALWVVADRLAQLPGAWAPFTAPSFLRHLYPLPVPGPDADLGHRPVPALP